jgi:hypothetical protein
VCRRSAAHRTDETPETQHSAVVSKLRRECSTGALAIYRKSNKPPLGPLGDSLDDFEGTQFAARPNWMFDP